MSNTTNRASDLSSSKSYRVEDSVAGEYWLAANTRSTPLDITVPGPDADEPPVDPQEGLKAGVVGALLAHCTPKQREVLELHVVQRMSLQEVATELGISKQSVHERFRLAVKNARQAAENGAAGDLLEGLGLHE